MDIVLNIINESLQASIFPSWWNELIVFPIEKIKNKSTTKCGEFKPINAMKTLEKSTEMVVTIQF